MTADFVAGFPQRLEVWVLASGDQACDPDRASGTSNVPYWPAEQTEREKITSAARFS
jgi:hypothetical protein